MTTKANKATETTVTGKNLSVIDTMVPGLNLNAYITAVNGIPILTAEEELDLANKYYYQEDLNAARKLVLAHMRFVVFSFCFSFCVQIPGSLKLAPGQFKW